MSKQLLTFCRSHPWLMTLLSISVIFLLRTLNTAHFEIYDAFQKWVYANMVHHGYYKIPKHSIATQHYMRWAINLPTALAISLFGFSLRIYFAVPILAFSVFLVLFLRRSAKELALPFLILLGVLIYVDPMMVRMSTQLHTRIFGTLYILLCIFSLEMKNRRAGIILSAVFLVCAYGAKETYGLFFGPAIGLFVLFKRSKQEIILFGLTILVLLGIETLIINQLVHRVTWGRFETLLSGKHMNSTMLGYKNLTLWKMMTYPWTKFSVPHQFIAAFSFGYAALNLAIPRLRKRLSQFQLLIHACIVSYFMGCVLSFIRLDPYLPMQPPRTTYYAPIFPFMYFSNMLLLQNILTQLANISRIKHFTRIAYALMLICALSLATAFAMQKEIFPLRRSTRYVLYHVPYGTAFWNSDEKLLKTAQSIKKGGSLMKRRYDYKDKATAMIFNIRQTSPELRNRKQYRWYSYRGKKFFGKRGMRLSDRKECIYMPAARKWILFMPSDRNTHTCPFAKKQVKPQKTSKKSSKKNQ